MKKSTVFRLPPKHHHGLLLGAALAPLALAVAATGAQAQQSANAAADAQDEVIVTGSRIARANLSSPSPVTTVNAAEFEARGVIRVEDLLNTLPQVSPAEGSSRANEAAGTANVDLRGLGAERTLVLIDGKRMPYGSPISAPADLNQIPGQLIERVEVLTGGASAVYGADAVAGVVNFIMDDDFEGVELDFQAGAFQTGNSDDMLEQVLRASNQPVPGSTFDGRSVDFNIKVGMNTADGRGNVTAYFNWRNQNEVLQGDRISSACSIASRNNGNDFTCRGSDTSFPGLFTNAAPVAQPFSFTLDGNGGIRDYNPDTDTYNFAPLNHFIRPNERFSAGFFGRYDLTDEIEFYTNFQFNDDRTTAQIAPTGNFFQTSVINCDNPLLSAEQLQVICLNNGVDPLAADPADRNASLNIGRRNVEGGGRQNEIRHTSYRIVGGIRGDLDDSWSYDVFGQYSTVLYTDKANNFFNLNNLRNALEVRIDPETGQPACQVAIDGTDAECAPWNPFSTGGVTQEALDYIQAPGLREGTVTQKVFGAVMTGDLTKYGVVSPFAETGVQTAFGFEYRDESLTQNNDFLTRSGGLGVARPDVDGSIAVYEFFMEAQIPLVQDAPFARELSINGAYRFSDFWQTTGAQSTYAAGVTWAPTDDLRIRGQYQRATRSPNPIELFSPQAPFEFTLPENPNGTFDPCSGPTPQRSFEECARTGVTAAQYGQILDSSAAQFRNISGGNPDLDVESSDTFTIGLVATPDFIPGLTFSIDYFNIEVNDFISSVPEEVTINNCLDTGDEFFCGLINRDAGGRLWGGDEAFVVATNVNTGSLKTAGIDFSASYSFGIGRFGDIRVDYLSTYLDTLEKVPLPGEPAFECAGFFASTNSSCGVSSPKYRHRVPVTWNTPWADLSAQVTWRYFGGVDLFGDTTGAMAARLDTQNYFDLSFRASVTDDVTLRGGVNNIFDNNPPVSPNVGGAGGSFGNGNTFPQVYDALGRFLFIGATVNF